MSSSLAKTIKKLGKEVAQRNKAANALKAELLPTPSEKNQPQKKSNKGLTSKQIVEHAEDQLILDEQLGLFTAIPVAKKNVLPTLLTRIPLFMVISKAKQKMLLDQDNALPFKTSFGEGKRYGPNLGVFDEDVMYAMARLSKKRLSGKRNKLPISVPVTYKADKDDNVHVYAVICTVVEILNELGLATGGRERRRVIESIEHLCGTTIVLTLNKQDRYLGKCELGKPIKLLDVEWGLYSSDGFIYGQFSPVFTYWLEEEYTYLDWDVRIQLKTALAKGLHRYLSSQLSNRNKDLTKLNQLDLISLAIGYTCRKKDVKRNYSEALEELVRVNYLLDYAIIGTGRAKPFVLLATKY